MSKISVSFLLNVWSKTCKDGDTVFLSTKCVANGRWKDHPLKYKRGIVSELKEWLVIHDPNMFDVYFCPLPFKGPSRSEKKVTEIKCLWSDIDEGNPKLNPSILWESSPGRLQGLWFLSGTPLNPGDGKALNKALTYYMGADKGGWDLTQVLRVPGTKNHKYETTPVVRILQQEDQLSYSPSRVAKRIGFEFDDFNKEPVITHTNNLTFAKVFSKYRRKIPIKVRQLLTQKNVTTGNRSDIIWYLENKLHEAGLSPDEIITLIKHSAWNKYAGRHDEDERLKIELEKIIESKVEVPVEESVSKSVDEETSEDLVVEDYHDLMCAGDTSPGWLIKGFWLNRSHGIVAGEPKSFKSTVALDLAVSVASGKPFLDKYEVVNPGPVVYIQNENSTWIMKDRVNKISASKGVVGEIEILSDKRIDVSFAPNIPLYFVNQQSYLLTDPLHQQALESIIKKYKPALIVLDPLYLMFDGDINSAKELAPVLQWLLDVRYRLNCGIMVIHHWNKGGEGTRRGGQRMLGSTTLHGWIESAWYLQTDSTETSDQEGEDVISASAEAIVTMEREFRGAGLHPRIDCCIQMGEIGTTEYSMVAQVHKKKSGDATVVQDLEKEILMVLSRRTRPMTLEELFREIGGGKRKLQDKIDTMCSKQIIRNNRGRYKIIQDD